MEKDKKLESKIEELEEWYDKEKKKLENKKLAMTYARQRIDSEFEDVFQAAHQYLRNEFPGDNQLLELNCLYHSYLDSVEEEYRYRLRQLQDKESQLTRAYQMKRHGMEKEI